MNRLIAEMPVESTRPLLAVEQLAAQCGSGVTRLNGDLLGFLPELPRLGRVQCVTGNSTLTHERFGVFAPIEFYQDIGVVMGEDIDLRLYLNQWRHGFAVSRSEERKSFQFFDAHGTPVHKIVLQPESDDSFADQLTERFRAEDQSTEIELEPPEWSLPKFDADVDVTGFQRAWSNLEDTANFVDILKRFGISREQGLRLAPPGSCRQVGKEALRRVLEQSASILLPIMIFARSPGCIQIHSGPIRKIKMFGKHWLNILDDDFNLHLKTAALASVWVVSKPTIDGAITSLELFDKDGENVALLFGKRGYGKPERLQWREMLRALE